MLTKTPTVSSLGFDAMFLCISAQNETMLSIQMHMLDILWPWFPDRGEILNKGVFLFAFVWTVKGLENGDNIPTSLFIPLGALKETYQDLNLCKKEERLLLREVKHLLS